MRDLRAHGCDIVTIGQYLRPTLQHLPVERYYNPSEYEAFREHGRRLGFAHVEAGPLVRSSYHAEKQVPSPSEAPTSSRSTRSLVAECDIAIIGGGPGGYVAAIRAAQLGKSVVLIEKERVGGLCLNWGCIPSKALLWNAEVVNLVRDAETYGISVENARFDMGKAIDRSRQVVDQMVKGVEFLLNKHGVRTIIGEASFASPRQIRVHGLDEPIDARDVIIATGARPRALPGLVTDGETIIDSRDALALKETPESVVIIGGGPIGVEFAQFWRAYGVEVTILELLDHLLPLEDEEISVQLERAYKQRGIKFHTGAQVAAATALNGRATVGFTAGGKEQELQADKVLIGIGFEANVEGLSLDKIGVSLDHSYLKTDGRLMTGASGVYAIGDVTGIMNMAHVASAMGVTVVERYAASSHPI